MRMAESRALTPSSDDELRGSMEMMETGYSSKSNGTGADKDKDGLKLGNSKRNPTFRERYSRFPWKPFWLIMSLPLALSPIVILATAAEKASEEYVKTKECYPNGKWNEIPDPNSWRIMDSSYFFTPNLSFGKMTFTEAKVIDIAWDLIVGRGVQLLLAWVNWRVFNEWILYHMEMHLTSYKFYTAVAFEPTTLSTLGVLGKEFLAFGESNFQRFLRWVAVLGMFLSTLYVISFPTFMAAMTGYITTYEPYIETYDGALVPFQQFEKIHSIIQDNLRIPGNFTKPVIAVKSDMELRTAVLGYMLPHPSTRYYQPYYDTLGNFSVVKDTDTTWKFEGEETRLLAPSLNITFLEHVVFPPNFVDNGYIGRDNKVNGFYSLVGRQGDIYNSSYMLMRGSCKPSETYQWGFSYIFMFMMSIFNFVWACIMVGMWFDTTRSSRMYKSGKRPGLLRSILDISAVIKEELGDRADELQEDDLRQALQHSGGALVVPENELKIERKVTRDAHKRWTWKRRLTRGSTF